MKKIILITVAVIASVSAIFMILLFTGIIWRSPPRYTTSKTYTFRKPIMTMVEYGNLSNNHERPYIYTLKKDQGTITIIGIEHTFDPHDPQIDSIQKYWEISKPTAALVEGRLGFLFQGIQDPVAAHGEGGKLIRLAKKDGIPFYSWEPDREQEVQALLKRYPAKQLALFYSLRPYFSGFRFGKPADPNGTMQKYIDERTAVKGLKGEILTVRQVDSIWQKDFPSREDWRNTSDEYGWPEGYLSDIFNASNLYRDQHLCSMIMELAEKGEHVIVTMGSSHAFRIRQTLESEMK
ncbi:MAG TPA: hypothetical protein VK166_07615 [Chitinophagaceae bacterium]|nr:hypothetical protein [Chitinophagaceae bacterium]